MASSKCVHADHMLWLIINWACLQWQHQLAESISLWSLAILYYRSDHQVARKSAVPRCFFEEDQSTGSGHQGKQITA